MSLLALTPIPRTSPSLAETMRACRLRAGLSRAAGIGTYVLGNPKAWLGTAYHEVLERVAGISTADVDAEATDLWEGAIALQHQRSSAHLLNRRFGAPETWPSYHLVRASALVRARELAVEIARSSVELRPHEGQAIRERQFVAFGGKLIGKPDVIRGEEVVDYKSGAILEYDEVSQTDVVKAAYVRQLKIYGFLVKSTLGWWPTRGVVFPFAGSAVEVPLERGECEREAADAVAALDDYNTRIAKRATPEQLAAPSPSACKWCSFKLVCTPLWSAVRSDWSGQLEGAVVEGVLHESPRAVYGGAAVSLSVEVQNGSEERRRMQIGPLDPKIHSALTAVSRGDQVRLVGLRVRPDRSLVPTSRTVLARLEDLPRIDAIGTDPG